MSIRKEKIEFFERAIADFGRRAGREHLPWRKRGITAYEVWVSEVMLQQTQVSRVIGYYERFLKRFPTVETLARASWGAFLPYYEGLGYYARGRNMLRAAQVVIAKHQGKFPRDTEALCELPGIGPYTAAAIMSFAYGDRHLAWDTNLRRVIGRFFFGSRRADIDEAYWERTLSASRKQLNAALMDFGSALCVARPKCGACPLRLRCVYYRMKGSSERPAIGTSRIKNSCPSGGRALSTIDRVVLFLHEHHKIYFSSAVGRFQPFILPRGILTRAVIKAYFREHYSLQLSVRPPFGVAKKRGEDFLLMYAQILLGKPHFRLFPKEVATSWLEKNMKGGILTISTR